MRLYVIDGDVVHALHEIQFGEDAYGALMITVKTFCGAAVYRGAVRTADYVTCPKCRDMGIE
jgi:hypothetical protein